MTYTQLKVKAEYREKLKALADSQHRSMANMLEVLIDKATPTLYSDVRPQNATGTLPRKIYSNTSKEIK